MVHVDYKGVGLLHQTRIGNSNIFHFSPISPTGQASQLILPDHTLTARWLLFAPVIIMVKVTILGSG